MNIMEELDLAYRIWIRHTEFLQSRFWDLPEFHEKVMVQWQVLIEVGDPRYLFAHSCRTYALPAGTIMCLSHHFSRIARAHNPGLFDVEHWVRASLKQKLLLK